MLSNFMSSPSIDIDDYINTIRSAVRNNNFIVDIDALVDHALEEACKCTRETNNLSVPQIDIGNNDKHVDGNSLMAPTIIAPTALIEDTEGVPNIAAVSNDISSENDTAYQSNLCFESTTSYSYFQIHLQVVHNKDQDYDMIKHPQLAPNLGEFNTYCHPCEQECISVMHYQQHIQSKHHVSLRYNYIKGLGIGSNPIDLDYYCGVYKVHLKASGEYQGHLQSQHHLDQLSAVDPINYCPSCNITYLTQGLYQRHLYYRHQVHQIDADPNKLPTIILPLNYCYHCDKQYRNNAKYVRYLKHKHKKILLQHKRLPKLSELGYLCVICQIKFTTQTLLQDHSKDVHVVKHGQVKIEEVDGYLGSADRDGQELIDVTPTDPHAAIISNPNRMSPDIDNHDYCRSCQTAFLSNWNYRIHLRLVHYIYVEKKPRDEAEDTSDNTLLPDLYDFDWYCRICKKYKKSSRSYRKHCKRAHHMKVKRREAH